MSWLREPDAEPIPGYRLICPLGTGGFGEVWKCQAPGGIYKAIKFVFGNLNSLEGDQRAEQELRALEKVKEVRYPFVCNIERIDIVEGELAIVMELADRSLYDRMVESQSSGRMGIPREELITYLRDAADGLDHLHERYGLLHLDVKPRNLFLVAGRVKVADFGLVTHLERQNSSGMLGGVSPYYAAPETFTQKISRHSDQYSLAIVYFELLTGQRPFSGKNLRQLALQHMSEKPNLNPLPEHDRDVLAKALSKDPEERFPNCTAFIRALALSTPGLASEMREGLIASGDWGKGSRATLSDLVLESVTANSLGELRLPGVSSRPETKSIADEFDELVKTSPQIHIGILRPTIMIGLGDFGRRALLEIRCRLLDRVGDLSLIPSYRYIYIESDSEAANMAINGPVDVVLNNEQVFPMPLQPVGNYRRRILDHLCEWIPREKLYAIPRSLQAHGSRALGRLSFHDHYLRFTNRIKKEIQFATHPEAIAQSISQTGLPLRDNKPQIFLFAAAGGASSGMLIDLAYSLKHQLNQLQYSDAGIILHLFCGAPTDPAATSEELANIYATLREINHFSNVEMTFTAQYGGPDGPKLAAHGSPFRAVYICRGESRTPEEIQACVGRLAGYVGQELTTPLAGQVDMRRTTTRPGERLPFRSFGTSSVWFPRGLLLRSAARQALARLTEIWALPGNGNPVPGVAELVERIIRDPRLVPDVLGPTIERTAQAVEGSPVEQVNRMLARIEEQIPLQNRDTAGHWSKQSFEIVKDWVGLKPSSDADSLFKRSRLSKLLEPAIQRVADEIHAQIFGQVTALLDHPDKRLVAGEEALRRLSRAALEMAGSLSQRVYEVSIRCKQARVDVQTALDVCASAGSGFFLLGTRTGRSLRAFFEQMRNFAQQRLIEDLLDAQVQVFRKLQSRFDENLRDLAFCRHRLNLLHTLLMSPADRPNLTLGGSAMMERTPTPTPVVNPIPEALRNTATLRVILPEGETDLDRSAYDFLAKLDPRQFPRLDAVLQSLVLTPRGGMFTILQKTHDLLRDVAGPLIDQGVAFLSELLPTTDVAQVEYSVARAEGRMPEERLMEYHRSAEPSIVGPTKEQSQFLIVPETNAGHELGEDAQEAFPEMIVIPVEGHAADLMLCREQDCLPTKDMRPFLEYCRKAYDELLPVPVLSPHARFDVVEWLPLED